MKSRLITWTVIRAGFEALVWATATWCILDPFIKEETAGSHDSLLVQCFWIFFVIHFFMNYKVVNFVCKYSEKECEHILKTDFMLVISLTSISLITAVIPAIGGVVFFSLISRWTHMPPDWLRIWMFSFCLCYNLSRHKAKRALTAQEEKAKETDQLTKRQCDELADAYDKMHQRQNQLLIKRGGSVPDPDAGSFCKGTAYDLRMLGEAVDSPTVDLKTLKGALAMYNHDLEVWQRMDKELKSHNL